MDPNPAPHRDGLRLLGKPAFVTAQSETPLPAERRTRLLAYLACRRTWVSRNDLLALFWPDRDPESARNNLRYVLLKLRRLPAAADLEVRGESLRWAPAADLEHFEQAIATTDWTLAIQLYRGPLLDGFEHDAPGPFIDWLTFERARLAAHWRGAVHHRLADPATAIPVRTTLAAQLLRDDPLDQVAVAALMQAHTALGAPSVALQAYRDYAERLASELGVEPAAAMRDLARSVQSAATGAGSIASTSAREATPLAHPQSLIGRRSELGQVEQLLAIDDCRVLTLTGPGGIGKSLLARAAMARVARHFADGAGWVALEDVHEVSQAALRCADAAGVVLDAGHDPVASLARKLQNRRVLLVLDNSEHLPQVADLATTVVRESPHLKLLVTSRVRLGCRGEWLLPLQGLAVPDEGETDVAVLRAFDAVKLFELRARAARFEFDLGREAAAVNELTRQVEGMPLALELAAAWVRLLPVREIVRDLHQSLELLAGPALDAHHERSMHASFGHSWALLVPAEQRALAALSVFTGSFSRESAAQIADAPLPLLAALADKSLVRAGDDGRFSLHPLIRQCAAEQLASDASLADDIRARHAAYFSRFMAQFQSFHAVDQAAALRAIGAELPNVLAAWNWSLQRNELHCLAQCAPGLGSYFQMRGPIQEGLDLLERAERALATVAHGTSDAHWMLPLERGSLHHSLAQYRQVEEAARRALTAARRVGHGFGIRTSLNSIAIALMRQGRVDRGGRYLSEALKRAREAQAGDEIPYYAGNLGTIKFALGDYEAAAALAHEALAGYRTNKQQIGMMQSLGELGTNCFVQGRTREAIDWLQQGLRVATDAGLDNRRCHFLNGLALAYLDLDDLENARRAAERSMLAYETSREPSQEPNLQRTLAEVTLAAGKLADARGHLQRAVAAARGSGSPQHIVPIARTFARWLAQQGQTERAVFWICWADLQKTTTPLSVAARSVLARIRARHSAAEIERADAAARAMTLAEAVQELAVDLARTASPPAP